MTDTPALAAEQQTKHTLCPGQTWKPNNGKDPRQTIAVRVCRVYDNYPEGIVIVQWATSATKQGCCTEKASRAWIKKNGATL